MDLMVFSKHLAGIPLPIAARRLRQMEISKIDLTVREGGHVEPSKVREDLPRAAAELAGEGVQIGMLTTNITDAGVPATRAILETAAELGVSHYKLGYYFYQGFGNLRKQRAQVRAQVRDLAQLNAEIGICGGFHNHSDNFIGACLHDIDFVLEGTPKSALGLYFDPAHASIEGGSKGWEIGLDLLSERVVMLAVKDYRWNQGSGYAGGRAFHVQWNPLEVGNVPWPRVLERLKSIGFDGPFSLHSEYQGSNSFQDLTTDEVFEQTARDNEIWRAWTRDAGF